MCREDGIFPTVGGREVGGGAPFVACLGHLMEGKGGGGGAYVANGWIGLSWGLQQNQLQVKTLGTEEGATAAGAAAKGSNRRGPAARQ